MTTSNHTPTVQEIAQRYAYGHLVDELAHGDFERSLNTSELEAFELLIALKLVRAERDTAFATLSALDLELPHINVSEFDPDAPDRQPGEGE